MKKVGPIATKYNTQPNVILYIHSAANNLHLTREQLMQRQLDKIQALDNMIARAPKSITRREHFIIKYPLNKERNLLAIERLKQACIYNMNKKGYRLQMYQFLQSIDDSQYYEITHMT